MTAGITPQQAEAAARRADRDRLARGGGDARHAVFIGRTAHQERPLAGHRRRRGVGGHHCGRRCPAAARHHGDRRGKRRPPPRRRASEPSFVLVDPLDGTKEFLAGRDEFTVNVAIVTQWRSGRRHRRGAGARAVVARRRRRQSRTAAAAARRRSGRKPMTAASSARGRRPSGSIVATSRSHLDEATEEFLARLPVAKTFPLRLGGEILPPRGRRGRRLSAAVADASNGTSPPAAQS